jgi:3-oxoacyl-(acyl-carrier-protein) synthase
MMEPRYPMPSALRWTMRSCGPRISLIVAHANGTPQSDVSEAAAILRVFGADMRRSPVSSGRSDILLAASGIIEAVQALWALRSRTCPGLQRLASSTRGCGASCIARTCTPRSDIALALSRGFAGTNAALILRAAGR